MDLATQPYAVSPWNVASNKVCIMTSSNSAQRTASTRLDVAVGEYNMAADSFDMATERSHRQLYLNDDIVRQQVCPSARALRHTHSSYVDDHTARHGYVQKSADSSK